MMLIIFLVQLSSCANGPSNDPADVDHAQGRAVSDLQADFDQFRRFLEDSHPQLYRFTPKHTFDSLFTAHYNMIDRPMSTQEFYRVLIPLVAKVGCGHTSLWSPDGFWDIAPDEMFPLGVHAMDGQLYIVHSYRQGSTVEYGSRILSINGRDADELVAEMLGNIWSDGMILTKRYRRLNEVFPYLYALMYGFPEQFEMLAEIRGSKETVIAGPVSRQVLTDYHNFLVESGIIPVKDLSMDLVKDGIAVMRIRTFSYYSNVKDFHWFIDSSFQVMRERNVGNLIIDLRGNQGGDPWCSSHLLRYLQKEPVVYFSQLYGSYASLNSPLPMADEPYTGKQYYLIDGRCFSTTGHITSLLKYHDLGTFIGEESGATYTCNDASHEVRLKHTGYRLRSARRTFATAVWGLPVDRGILPDHEVLRTIEDVIEHRDPVWEFTLELINRDH